MSDGNSQTWLPITALHVELALFPVVFGTYAANSARFDPLVLAVVLPLFAAGEVAVVCHLIRWLRTGQTHHRAGPLGAGLLVLAACVAGVSYCVASGADWPKILCMSHVTLMTLTVCWWAAAETRDPSP